MKLIALVACLVAGTSFATVTGDYRVTLRKGSTNQAPVCHGATLAEAYACCVARIPKTGAGATQYSCETPRFVAVVTPDPIRSAMLSWTPPTTNTDGSALTNLAGYRISYGTSAGALIHAIQVSNPALSVYTVENLAPGTYYFVVKAYTTTGAESTLSNIVSKKVL